MFYLLLSDGEVLRWLGTPGKWDTIGDDGRITSMAAAGSSLFLLLSDGEVLRWLGTPGKWDTIGNDGRITSMAAAGSSLFLLLSDGEVLRWLGTPGKWDTIGKDGRITSMAAAGSSLFLLLSDGEVLRWLGTPGKWDTIGNDGRITSMAAAESSLFLLLSDGEVLRWLGTPGKWDTIGKDGRIASMAAAGSSLFLLLSDGEVLRWLGTPGKWDTIGKDGRITSMAAARSSLSLLLSDGEVLRWLGTPGKWDTIGKDGRITSMAAADVVVTTTPNKQENPELGDPTGQGKDKNKQDSPTDPPPESGQTKTNPVTPQGPDFSDGPPPPPSANGCFIGRTPVLMADGLTKRIDAIAIGDQIMARDEKTGLVTVGDVDRVFRHHVAKTLLLETDGGEVIETTAEHRFAAEERGFVSAGQLRPGDRLSTHSERGAGVVATGERLADVTVYNLSVDRVHTFFIGGAGLWVHNVKKADPEEEPNNG